MEKVLVIGGSGFLGSHVADKLSDSGFEVSIFDIKPSKWIRDDQEFIEGSILDSQSLHDAIGDKTVSYTHLTLPTKA